MKNIFLLFILSAVLIQGQDIMHESKQQRDARMHWWRDARFGMFIHWGLYSIPAGEWRGTTNHAEWIRTTAQIPLEEYDKFLPQFNPVKFNAEEWVRMAKDAGMKYIVITSKHHDGFCLFDSKHTDFDIMSTSFKRDILKELADACRKQGMKMCFYHSIMDWHHPDYLPRREWEKNRSAEGVDFSRFVQYLKSQLKEIITNYGDIGVLWFDGEWEGTWTKELGDDLYKYVRSLDKNIIVNNRVSKGRAGMEGFTEEGGGAGDFGTPEQQIPSTGLPGADWESCITMNDNWGFNKYDNNFKSTKYILQMLSDIASKGGNLLLNVGPTSEGLFPDESIKRLAEIRKWMKVNGEAIYGTQASPFKKLEWGRSTQKQAGGKTRIYLHIFDWPADGKLLVPGLMNSPESVYLLSGQQKITYHGSDEGTLLDLPEQAPDENISVVVLDITGKPDIVSTPEIINETGIFVNSISVKIKTDNTKYQIRYTTDGSDPVSSSPVYNDAFNITETAVVAAKVFNGTKPLSATGRSEFKKVSPLTAVKADGAALGIKFRYFEGDWNTLPDFSSLSPKNEGVVPGFSLSSKKSPEQYGFEFSGCIKIPSDGAYTFYTESDDGSRLFIGDSLVVDNDGLHGMVEKKGTIALQAGYHPVRVLFFEKSGGDDLIVSFKPQDGNKQVVSDSMLFH